MVVSVQCTECGLGFQVPDEYAGRQVKCQCGAVVEVTASSSMIDLLSEELKVSYDPLLAETPEQWAKATGADPDIAAQIEKRMAKKLRGNAGFMMAITGIVIAVMLIIGLVAFLMASKKQPSGNSRMAPAYSSGVELLLGCTWSDVCRR